MNHDSSNIGSPSSFLFRKIINFRITRSEFSMQEISLFSTHNLQVTMLWLSVQHMDTIGQGTFMHVDENY